MQFGAKPLFENISVKFGGGNRYGLIGANGSGKSTLMKILGGDLQPSSGNVSVDANERLGKLRQDQFAFENYTVLDTVIMGHAELWQVKQERDRIYSLAHMSEEDGMAVAELEVVFGELGGYPGNNDDFMTASTQARERLLSDNAKKKAQIADLQTFVSRFSANASKAKQATSRAKQIEKIKLDEVKPSSRVSPFIRFAQEKKLYRLALEVKDLGKSYGEQRLFSGLNMLVEVGERVASIGPNGIGKSTLLRCLMGELPANEGTIQWSQNCEIGYFAQDHAADFAVDMNLFDWMARWAKSRDDAQAIKAVLGRLLFSSDEIKKRVKVLAGGVQGRMLFCKLMLQQPNIMILDEPTNHLDMEAIEALNLALENYPGTLLFVSHAREFVSSLAPRSIELTPHGVVNFCGTYDEYLQRQAEQEMAAANTRRT